MHQSNEELLENTFTDIGGFGKFQLFACITLSSGISATSFWLYEMGYLTQKHIYKCSFNNPSSIINPADVCTVANICGKNSQIASWQVDWNSEVSLHNWQEKLDLMCEPEWKINLLITGYFLGWCATLLWVPFLSDQSGRKHFVAFSNIASLILFTVMLSCHNLNIMIGTMFCFGALASCRITIGIPYLMELVPKASRTVVFTVCAMVDVSIYLLGTIYFWIVNKHWFYFWIVGYILQIFASIAVWFLPESPVLLVQQRRLEETRRSLRTIAWMNKCDFSPIYSFEFLKENKDLSKVALETS